MITKNPEHPSWRTIVHNKAVYDLEDFQEWMDITPTRKLHKLLQNGDGRNTTLFNNLRLWAYTEVKTHSSYEVFLLSVDSKAFKFNHEFDALEAGSLQAKEVLSTAKSIGRWTWKHRHSLRAPKVPIMNLPADMPLREKQSAGAFYSHKVRTESIDEKIKAAIFNTKAKGLPLERKWLLKNGLSDHAYFTYKDKVLNWIKAVS